jgi:protein tyrosine phosphatase (PTP) superfamily phosphohydrolase (DUF442 family)
VDFGSLVSSRRFKLVALVMAVAVMSVLSVGLGARFSTNVHVIEPGLAYRSGQLWPGELEGVIAEYGIRSIVSLVAPEPDQTWYRGELAISSARGIARYEMPLSARKELTSAQLRDLVVLLRKAPKPVLIHSKSGADRSGLAAAIFKYAIAARSAEEAKQQLSLRYGHFPYLWSGTDAMDASFNRFVAEQRSAPPTSAVTSAAVDQAGS